jgi:hypothetical protein
MFFLKKKETLMKKDLLKIAIFMSFFINFNSFVFGAATESKEAKAEEKLTSEEVETKVTDLLKNFKKDAETAINTYKTEATKLLKEEEAAESKEPSTLYADAKNVLKTAFDQYFGLKRGSTQWRALDQGAKKLGWEGSEIQSKYQIILDPLQKSLNGFISEEFKQFSGKKETKEILYDNLIRLQKTLFTLFSELRNNLFNILQMESSYETTFIPSLTHILEHKEFVESQDALKEKIWEEFDKLSKSYGNYLTPSGILQKLFTRSSPEQLEWDAFVKAEKSNLEKMIECSFQGVAFGFLGHEIFFLKEDSPVSPLAAPHTTKAEKLKELLKEKRKEEGAKFIHSQIGIFKPNFDQKIKELFPTAVIEE